MVERRIFWGMTIAALLVIGAYVAFFWGKLSLPLSKDPTIWGAFGDYVGGVLNPFVALFGLYFVIATLKQNQVALSQADKALKQTEKALAQSERALLQNAEELSNSRAELTESRKAQQNLADTEKKNLELQMSQFRISAIQARLEYLDTNVDIFNKFNLDKELEIDTGRSISKISVGHFSSIPNRLLMAGYRIILQPNEAWRMARWLTENLPILRQQASLLAELKDVVEGVSFTYIPPSLPLTLKFIEIISSLHFFCGGADATSFLSEGAVFPKTDHFSKESISEVSSLISQIDRLLT